MGNQQPSSKKEWETVQEYDRYEVNALGEIRHKNRKRILKPRSNPGGYLYVSFNINGKRRNYAVHRIVASAFIDNPDRLPEVNHKDHNRQNNNVDNLEWVSSSANKSHANKLSTNRHSRGKKISQYTKQGEYIKTFPTITEAAQEIGLTIGAISNCASGRSKTSGGYIWKFAEGSTTKYNRNP